MSRSDSAQILIAIRGGVEAARQAAAVADEMDHLGTQTRQAGEDAAGAAGGFALLGAELDRTKRKMDLARVSSEGMSVAAIGLSLHYLPALASTLGNVAVSGGIVAAAFGAGALALGGTLVGMGKAIEARYKATVNVVGSAANKLHNIITSLSLGASFATAPGADAALGGIAAGLAPLRGVLKTLTPQITAIGRAMGSAFKGLGKQLASEAPQIQQMLKRVPAAVKALGGFAGNVLKLFIRLGTAGLPLVVKALRFAAKLANSLTRALTDKKINGSVSTLVNFGKTLGKIFTVVYTGAQKFVKQLLKALKPAEPFLKNVIAPLLLGVWKGIQGLLPGIKLLAKGLGFLGTAAKPLKKVFQDIGYVISILFGGELLKGIGAITKIIPWIGKAGDVFSLLGRTVTGTGKVVEFVLGNLAKFIGGRLGLVSRAVADVGHSFINFGLRVGGELGAAGVLIGRFVGAVGTSFGKIASLMISAISRASVFILGHLGKIVSFLGGLAPKIAHATVGIFDGIKDAMRTALNGVIDLWDSLHFTIGGWHISKFGVGVTLPKITVGMPHIQHLATGGMVTQSGPVLVGERGPELLNLPQGAEVTSNDQTASLLAQRRPVILHDTIQIGDKILAKVVRRVDADLAGRA